MRSLSKRLGALGLPPIELQNSSSASGSYYNYFVVHSAIAVANMQRWIL